MRWPLPSVCEDAEGRSVERGYSVEAVNPPVVVTPSLPLGATGIDYIVRHGRQWRSDAALTGSVGWNPRFFDDFGLVCCNLRMLYTGLA